MYKKVMGKLCTIDSTASLSGKTVLLRIDTDVDIEKGKILDDTRLGSALPTIKFLLKKRADINIVGHLGRPKPVSSIKYPVSSIDKKFSLEPVAKWFVKILNTQYSPARNATHSVAGGILNTVKVGNFDGWKITDRVNLIENIRFFKGEEENPSTSSGLAFARELALLGDIYVNDAFAVSHRAHASIVGVTKFLPSYAGLHLQKEVDELSKIFQNPKRPLAILIGGAKIETKLPLVEKMHRYADYVLVAGEIAEQTRVLIKVQHEKIRLPAGGKKSAILVAEGNKDNTDISMKSLENFKQILGLANTIVWNGPVGVIRKTEGGRQKVDDSERGTRELAHFIARTGAYKVVGGGDTIAYLHRINLLLGFDFVSTGGGAMLEFLSGHKLPGIKALER